jgi:hypothetical protein
LITCGVGARPNNQPPTIALPKANSGKWSKAWLMQTKASSN